MKRFTAEPHSVLPPTRTGAIGGKDSSDEAGRGKRQVEFIAGFVVSNVLTTIKDWLFTRTSSALDERIRNAEHQLLALNYRQDMMTLSQQAVLRTAKIQANALNQFQGQLNQMASINVILDDLIGEMQQLRAKHDRFFNSMLED